MLCWVWNGKIEEEVECERGKILDIFWFLYIVCCFCDWREGEFPLFIVVGQPLWFRLHVRCSFFIIQSIKTMVAVVGPNPKSKNWKTWNGKIIRWVPSHSSNHFILPLAFAFCYAPLLGNFGIPQFSICLCQISLTPKNKVSLNPFLQFNLHIHLVEFNIIWNLEAKLFLTLILTYILMLHHFLTISSLLGYWLNDFIDQRN